MSDENEMTEKEMTAALYFGVAFAEYVKEVDLSLWKRARDFAFDCATKVHGVSFTKTEDIHE